MSRRVKIDNRLRVLIENGVKLGHRTLFVIVGNKSRDQVVFLHHMLSKAEVKARPSVLWCYKKELGFSSHRTKRMKKLQRTIQAAGRSTVNEDDPFELFISLTKIRFCYYSETHKILGNTYGMCILQDFEALTPNLLARTIETVEGGGIVAVLLSSLTSLKQLYTMTMDVHLRYRTEAHQDVVNRFNERLILSLADCKGCLVIDDQLRVLPISLHNACVEPVERCQIVSANNKELNELKEQVGGEIVIVRNLINLCKTLDQANAVKKFVESITEKTLRSTVSLTAARGRGKSAALGLAVSAAVAFRYASIYVTSPSPENLNTFFEFVLKGLEALEYREHEDYKIERSSNPEFKNAIIKIVVSPVSKFHKQTIEYIHPTEKKPLWNVELFVIDEAAAIPLPFVKEMLGRQCLIFLASTINGYEGTGRSLSLKLLQQLRVQVTPLDTGKKSAVDKKHSSSAKGRTLVEITLEEPIRYKAGDPVEEWLMKLLCLDSTVVPSITNHPPPESCDLYYINRDALFSYNRVTEKFLQQLVSLYVASHYKNTPNDLQMMSDAPAHHLFCLLGPLDPKKQKTLPKILAVIQICLEGQISSNSIAEGRGTKAAGDLIPWTVSQQFHDTGFGKLCGARIVRIATHPDLQGMGYGSRAINLLKDYYQYKRLPQSEEPQSTVRETMETVTDDDIGLLKETIKPRTSLPPLFLKLTERAPERLDYIGVSFGLTEQLLKFWKRCGFVSVYVRQTPNELTGEHTCIMINVLGKDDCDTEENSWIKVYWKHFRERFVELLGFELRTFTPELALGVLHNKNLKIEKRDLTREELESHMSETNDLKRLEMYSNNLVDYHLINDLTTKLADFYFLNAMGDVQLSAVQSAILLGLGYQHKNLDTLAAELGLPSSQVHSILHKLIRKCTQYLNSVLEQDVEPLKKKRRESSD